MSKTLAEIVLDEALTGRSDLDEAAKKAEAGEVPLIVALVKHCGIDEVALVAAIRRQMRVPLVDPGQVSIDPDAVRELPREVCERRRLVPVGVEVFESGPRTLRLAMADPSDAVAVAEVEHLSGCRVERELMTLSAVEELIETAYRGYVTQVMKREEKDVYGRDPSVSSSAVHRGVADALTTKSTTSPHERLSDEELLGARVEALVRILVEKGILSTEEYEQRVSDLMRRRSRDE